MQTGDLEMMYLESVRAKTADAVSNFEQVDAQVQEALLSMKAASDAYIAQNLPALDPSLVTFCQTNGYRSDTPDVLKPGFTPDMMLADLDREFYVLHSTALKQKLFDATFAHNTQATTDWGNLAPILRTYVCGMMYPQNVDQIVEAIVIESAAIGITLESLVALLHEAQQYMFRLANYYQLNQNPTTHDTAAMIFNGFQSMLFVIHDTLVNQI